MSEATKGEAAKKRKTSNGLDTKVDPKKSKQTAPSEKSSDEILAEFLIEPRQPSLKPGQYIQIIVTGPQGCGKSTLVCSYMEELFPPEGANFLSKPYYKRGPSSQPVMIWDLDSRDEFFEYRRKSYEEADVAILCYDVKKTLLSPLAPSQDGEALRTFLLRWYNELKTHCKKDIGIILVGLKKDERNRKMSNLGCFELSAKFHVSSIWGIVSPNKLDEVSAHTNKDEVNALFEYAISIAKPQTKKMFTMGGFEIAN